MKRAVSTNPVGKCPVAVSLSSPTSPNVTRQPSIKPAQYAGVCTVCRSCSLRLGSHMVFCFYSENEEEMDKVKDNKVTLAIPLRYEVMLTVHG